jgi:hypothetical protein
VLPDDGGVVVLPLPEPPEPDEGDVEVDEGSEDPLLLVPFAGVVVPSGDVDVATSDEPVDVFGIPGLSPANVPGAIHRPIPKIVRLLEI